VNLILLEPREIDPHGIAVLAGERLRHLLTVLRVAPGDTVRVGIVDGPVGTATVQETSVDAATIRCAFGATPPAPSIDLLLALPRPKVLRRLWAQIAALGVGRLILTNAERVERNYFDTHVLQPAVYRPLLIEGLQQARDTRLPQVTIHRQFRMLVEDHLDDLSTADCRLVAHPAETRSAFDALASASTSTRVLLAIGPEGGWNAFELDALRAGGFAGIGLGERTLRSDTACIALLAVTHDALRIRRDG
jgi:RsmE family RNA methyltransferase